MQNRVSKHRFSAVDIKLGDFAPSARTRYTVARITSLDRLGGMEHFVSSPFFQVAVIPLVLMLIGVYAKRLGRRDGDESPRRNDWAVGTTILLMVLGTVLGDMRTAQAPIKELSWLIGVLVTAFISLDHDRFRSWERNSEGLPDKSKKVWVGIVFPDVACLAIFGLYQAQKVGAL